MNIVLGFDLGTSYFKTGAFGSEGQLVGLGRVRVPSQSLRGRCELPLNRFWSALRESVSLALAAAGAVPRDVVAVGYASQSNSFLLLDEGERPLTPLILWPDNRAPLLFPTVKKHMRSPDFACRTGLSYMKPKMCVQKLCWFQKNEPDLWSHTASLQTISDHLVFGLTGQRKSDLGTAALLGLADLRHGEWWPEALHRLRLEDLRLFHLHRPGTVAGPLLCSDPCNVGLPGGIPLVLGGLDHHMAALGAGLGHLADCCESSGTVQACLAQSPTFEPQPDCCLGPGVKPRTFYQLAYTQTGASGLEWYQEQFAAHLSISELMKEAATAPLGCDGLTARPEIHAPSQEEPFQGRAWQGEHGLCARAIMEANAAALARLLDRIYPDEWPRKILSTGGGARSPQWLQIKSDLLGAEMIQSPCEEPACKGAALLAAKAVGWFDETEKVEADWLKVGKVFAPDIEQHRLYQTWHAHYRKRYGQ